MRDSILSLIWRLMMFSVFLLEGSDFATGPSYKHNPFPRSSFNVNTNIVVCKLKPTVTLFMCVSLFHKQDNRLFIVQKLGIINLVFKLRRWICQPFAVTRSIESPPSNPVAWVRFSAGQVF